jgi:uncharacterized protein
VIADGIDPVLAEQVCDQRLLMPAFGVLTGGLDLSHKAFHPLFDRQALIAHLLGKDRVYSVRYHNLKG